MAVVVIRVGFSPVSCAGLRSATWKKGEALAVAGHVHNLEERRFPDKEKEGFIQANVVRQTATSNDTYRVTAFLGDDRVIYSARCACIAGIDAECKHFAAVVCAINNERCRSKTDFLQTWTKKGAKGKDLYPKGKRIDQILGDPDPLPSHSLLPPMDEQAVYLQQLAEFGLEGSQMHKMLLINAAIESEEATLPEEQSSRLPTSLNCIFSPENETIHYQETEDRGLLVDQLEGREADFFASKISITKEESVNICNDTRKQAASPLWHDARRCRISASRAHFLHRGRTPSTRESHFFKSPPPNIRALQYGRMMESEARSQYELETANTVIETGLVVRQDQPWICGSPDGLIETEEGLILLEIKCPISCKDKEIEVDYLVNGELKKGPYYCQVQTLMYICDISICHFYVFSKNDSKLITVHRDEPYL